MPAADLSETDDVVHIAVEVPGVRLWDLELAIIGPSLVCSRKSAAREEAGRNWRLVELRTGSFRRTVPLGLEPDSEAIAARFGDNVPLIEPFTTTRREQAERMEAAFRQRTDGGDTYTAEWRGVRAESTTAVERMTESARAADLLVMSRPEQESGYGEARGLQHDVIRASGRPMLVLPGGEAPEVMGRRVLVGWSATREVARAVHDALPLLEPGAEVTLLRVGDGGPDERADAVTNELAAGLARDGAKVTVTHRDRHGASVVDLLLREAFEIDADLIVTGAFGHSRAYDLAVGAATHELPRTSTLPALFSK